MVLQTEAIVLCPHSIEMSKWPSLSGRDAYLIGMGNFNKLDVVGLKSGLVGLVIIPLRKIML